MDTKTESQNNVQNNIWAQEDFDLLKKYSDQASYYNWVHYEEGNYIWKISIIIKFILMSLTSGAGIICLVNEYILDAIALFIIMGVFMILMSGIIMWIDNMKYDEISTKHFDMANIWHKHCMYIDEQFTKKDSEREKKEVVFGIVNLNAHMFGSIAPEISVTTKNNFRQRFGFDISYVKDISHIKDMTNINKVDIKDSEKECDIVNIHIHKIEEPENNAIEVSLLKEPELAIKKEQS